jgi:acetolactate synthase small subunit
LKRAQILQANKILTVDESEEHREKGISSITIGEAKQVYQMTKKIKTVIDKRAVAELSKWIVSGVRVSR